jgi:Ca2+/Na+ antiporter
MAKGLVDLALNGAIASEIHNILLGLGFPWLVYNLYYGGPIIFQINELYTFSISFFSVFLVLFLFVFRMNSNRLDKKLALFLIFIYLIFLVILFYFSFNIKFL